MTYKYTGTMVDLFPELLTCDHNDYLFSNSEDINEVKVWYHMENGKVVPKYYYLVCRTCGEELSRWW